MPLGSQNPYAKRAYSGNQYIVCVFFSHFPPHILVVLKLAARSLIILLLDPANPTSH